MFRYLCAIGIWLAAPLVVFALPFDAPVPTCGAMLYLYAGGPVLAFAFFILFFATRKKPQAAAALMIVLSLLAPIWYFGFTVGMRVHLFVNEDRYAETIREFYHTNPKEKVVVFHTCHCPFFWPDIVYDPGGEMRDNRGDLKKLDMYLMDYRHLTTFWYIGYFGD